MGNRGVLSSLGAGLSLIIAGVIVLAIVSAVIAFRGLPDLLGGGATADVTMAPVANADSSEGAPIVLPAARGRLTTNLSGSTPAREPAARRRTRRTRRAAGKPRSRSNERPRASKPATKSPTRSGSDSAAGTPAATQPERSPDPVERAAEGVDEVVNEVTSPKPAGQPPVDVEKVLDTTTKTVDAVAGDTTKTVEKLIP